MHSDAPLGFAGAIERGLARARMGGTYLLNNDMTLDARTRCRRCCRCAASASSRSARRSCSRTRAAGARRRDSPIGTSTARACTCITRRAPAADAARICARAAAPRCSARRCSRRYLPASRAYDPFYWEDVEWSVRAWRDGCDVLFCPALARVARHRATTARFYAREELDAHRRAQPPACSTRATVPAAAPSDGCMASRVRAAVRKPARARARRAGGGRVSRSALRVARAPQPLATAVASVEARACTRRTASGCASAARRETRAVRRAVRRVSAAARRRAPRRRVRARAQRDDFDVALVSDEASLYDARSFADFDGLVRRAPRAAQDAGCRRPRRSPRAHAEHCHPALRRGSARAMLRRIDPDVVVVEHAELAPLVALRAPGARWILDLHDAYARRRLSERCRRATRSRATLAPTMRSPCARAEDRGAGRASARRHASPTGARARRCRYAPSRGARPAVRRTVSLWPQSRRHRALPARGVAARARRRFPHATLTILGGDESLAIARGEPAFAQAGVQVLGHRDDVPRLLAQCTLAINPLTRIRGSAVKLVETLAAGRVCVTTARRRARICGRRAARPRRRAGRSPPWRNRSSRSCATSSAAPSRSSARIRRARRLRMASFGRAPARR